MKHISSSGPLLSIRKVLTNPTTPSTSEMTLRCMSLFSLWLVSILSFYTAFLCQSSYFFSLTWAVVGHFLVLLLLSVLCHCLQFELEYLTKEEQTLWLRGEGALPSTWGRGAVLFTRMIDTSQTLPFALIGCIEPEWWILANQIRPADSGFLHSWPVSYSIVRS